MGDAQFNGTPEEWDALVKKNKKKQTAVEWLVENVIISAPINWDTTIVKQALEMEKEQKIAFAKLHVEAALAEVGCKIIGPSAGSIKDMYPQENIK